MIIITNFQTIPGMLKTLPSIFLSGTRYICAVNFKYYSGKVFFFRCLEQ